MMNGMLKDIFIRVMDSLSCAARKQARWLILSMPPKLAFWASSICMQLAHSPLYPSNTHIRPNVFNIKVHIGIVSVLRFVEYRFYCMNYPGRTYYII